jgi:dipeptidyl aminopeptidase/acylaminoacyl peptidase
MKLIAAASLLAIAVSSAADARPLTIDDVTTLSRVGAPATSADGRWLVWAQRETDMVANRGRYDLWRLDLSKRGAKPEQLVAEPDVDENDPQIVGATVYYTANKGGLDAVWAVGIDGADPRKLTGFGGGFNGFRVAPTGDKLVVWADRKPGAPTLAPALEKKDPNAGGGRTYDQLFVRHWDTWGDGSRQQLFVLPLGPDGAPGDGVAVGRGLVGDSPSKPMGGGEEIAWSPDGRTLYFALRR